MANPEHLAILEQGVHAWNEWREAGTVDEPDLTGADLRGMQLWSVDLSNALLRDAKLERATLTGSDLSGADLRGADLEAAFLIGTNLDQADLRGARLTKAHLEKCDLIEADLKEADIYAASFYECDLTDANLSGSFLVATSLMNVDLTRADLYASDLTGASLVEAVVTDAEFTGSRVYGLSAWSLEGTPRGQWDLVITAVTDQALTVDNLEVAQFIHLLLTNPKIRDVIDTVGNKAVLILGRFTTKRKAVLEALRQELRQRDYVPIVFDFEKPRGVNLAQTVSTLAHMARFVIADLTDARSIPAELQRIVPDLPSVPVQPILLASQREYALFDSIKSYPWVLATHLYQDEQGLLGDVVEKVIGPAEAKAKELRA